MQPDGPKKTGPQVQREMEKYRVAQKQPRPQHISKSKQFKSPRGK